MGLVDVLDQGTSVAGIRARCERRHLPPLANRVDLLSPSCWGTVGLGGSLEAFALWIERAQDWPAPSLLLASLSTLHQDRFGSLVV